MRIANRIRRKDIRRNDVRQRRIIERIARTASNNAKKDALSNGRSVTIQKGEAIVKLHPDGSSEVIRKIEKSSVIPEKRLYYLRDE